MAGGGAGFEHCGHCDNCLTPPAPAIAVGSRVRGPKFDVGTVLAVSGEQVTIAFPDQSSLTFMAEFVEPL